jgi:hypothetical protein
MDSSPNQKSGWSPILLWLGKQKLCSFGHLPRSQAVLKGMVSACVAGRGKGMWRINTPDSPPGRQDKAGIPASGTGGIAGTLTSKPIGTVSLGGRKMRHSRKTAISQISVSFGTQRVADLVPARNIRANT